MIALIAGSLLLSLLHSLIPSHWLPILAIGKKENWSHSEILSMTLLSGFCHVVGTLLIGWGLAFFGWELAKKFQYIAPYISPVILIAIGVVFIYRHHKHRHFHLVTPRHQSKIKMIISLSLAMFFSPCLEIEPYFLVSATQSIWWPIILSAIYFFVTLTGMIIWVSVAYHSTSKFNWHKLEHNAGIITGITLIASGIISYFMN